jgi:pyruvate,water dikinase
VITPLTWDFVEKGFHRSLNHSFHLMGLPEYDGQWFACFGHYVYGNQNAVDLYARRSPVRLDTLGSLDALQTQLPELIERFRWVGALPERWHRELPAFLAEVQALLDEPLERADLAALWDYVQRVDAVGTSYFLPNIAISIGHGLLHRSLRALVGATGAPDAERLTATLVACETMTTRVNAELRTLAALAAEDSSLRERLEKGTSRALWQREGAAKTAFGQRLRGFLQEHGHRETDFDAYHPTWAEAPWVVLDQVRLLMRADGQVSSDVSRSLEQEEVERMVLQRVPPGIRALVATVIHLAREYTALDDLEHYHTTRLSRPMRRGIRAIGERLARFRIVDEPMDAFFARRETLAQAITQNRPDLWRALGAEVRVAKREYLAARTKAPAWLLAGGTADDLPAANSDLSGIPGSPGTIDGVVHVVNDVDDFAAFPQGAVLVARTTNPAWTPLFYSASAIVTESGGPLSHGAVTAREMRLPAVMAVRGVMRALVNGDRVRVDGTRGTVVRL